MQPTSIDANVTRGRYMSLLAIDWRDVVVAGEYELREGVPVQVPDLTQPLRTRGGASRTVVLAALAVCTI